MAVVIHRTDALRVAGKKLPFKSNRAITTMCDFAGLDVAEAYRCGAEEAQGEIIARLSELRTVNFVPPASPAPTDAAK